MISALFVNEMYGTKKTYFKTKKQIIDKLLWQIAFCKIVSVTELMAQSNSFVLGSDKMHVILESSQ